MRLTKLVIKGYRSIKGEQTLALDDRVTILIGANDHGKTNLLSAILCLNDDSPISSEDHNWDLENGSSVEIQWHFDLSTDDQTKLKALAPKLAAIAPAVGDPPEEGPKPEMEPTIQSNDEGALVLSRDAVTNQVRVVSAPLKILSSKEGEALKLRPRVELFAAPTTNVIDQVALSQLETPEFEFMQGIFRLAGLWESRKTIFAQNDTTSRQLKQASEQLTKVLSDKWNQGKELKWIFEHTGTNGDNIVIKIEDPAIQGRYTRPSLRSSGFRTYFLLSMIVYARSQNSPNDSHIYLFDEPGTYLHPSAQLDLQRSFETIADQAQVIYTTHSLFLVSKNYPSRNRVISKTLQGTKVDQKPFSRNWKSVRNSLGILLSNNFLIAEKTLLVEGPSDAIYLLDALRKLKGAGSLDVDLNDMSIVDAGDSQNYVAMAKVMLSEGRNIVALLDGDAAGKKLQAALQKVCAPEIDAKKLQIHILPENKSSEDVFCDLSKLRAAAKSGFEKLVADGSRKAADGLNLDNAVNDILPSAGTSLGRVLEKITKPWSDPAEKLSKLLVAIMYEDVARDTAPPALAIDELQKIKALLGLRSEKSESVGVFEEVSA